jgi:hypothetical protein
MSMVRIAGASGFIATRFYIASQKARAFVVFAGRSHAPTGESGLAGGGICPEE